MRRTAFYLFLITLMLASTQGWGQVTFYVDGANGNNSNNGSQGSPWQTITHAISQATAGDAINVAAGTYQEAINVNKTLTLTGANAASVIIQGPATVAQTVILSANNVVFEGFTVTRAGNNPANWTTNSNNTGLQIAQLLTGCTVQNCIITGNRNGIYLNNTQSHLLQNNTIDFNRTGLQLVNNVSGCTVIGNTITNNWTMGVVIYYNPNTLPATTNLTVADNNISGNWFSQVEIKTVSSFPTGTTYDFTKNYFGVPAPRVTTTLAGEPGYNTQIPVTYGGSATAPSTTVGELTGDAITLAIYSPWCAATPGSSPMTWGTNDNIPAAITAAASGDIIQIASGTYSGSVTLNKSITLTSAASSGSDPNAPVITGLITVASDDVTIKALKITNPSGNALYSAGWSSLSIIDNLFEAVGTTANTNVHAITFVGSSTGSTAILDDVLIDGNVFTNIGNPSSTYSNSAITFGFSDYNYELTNLIVQNNTISDINSNSNATTGKGAYGILINLGSGTGSGKVTAPIIRNNIISDLVGRWAHAIGLEGDTENALVENNDISAIVSTNSTPDASAVFIEKNHYTNSLTIRGNRFGTDVTYGVALHPDYFNPSASDLTWYNMNVSVNAVANFWGDNDGPCAPANHSDCSGYGVMVVPDVVYAPWTGQAVVLPSATIPNTTMDIGDDDITEIELQYVAVPETGGTIYITTYDTAPAGATAPTANVSKYIDITSDMPNGNFGMWITLTVTAGSATGNFLETPADTADNRLAYFNESTSSWVLVNGFYSSLPSSTGGVFNSTTGTAEFTFFVDHFTVFAFIGGSSASYYNTPVTAYPLYVARAPIAGLNDAVNRTVYPNSTWTGGYPGRTDDWGFSGSQPVTVFVVPGNSASFFSGSLTLQWVNGMLGSLVTVNGSDGTYSGLFTGANRILNSNMLGTTNTIRIDAARTDATNYDPAVSGEEIVTGDFLVKLGFTLNKPGSTGIDVIGADFRRYVNATAPSQYVYVEPFGTAVKAYLGDVANSTNQSSGDGVIDQADLAIWSNSYWSGVTGFSGGLTNYKTKFDVGPTVDGTPFSLPVPDTKIEFEDLVIFSISYGLSASNALPKGETNPASISLSLGDAVQLGNEIRIPLRMHAGTSDVRALKLRFDGIAGNFLGFEKGELLQDREESIPVFSMQQGSTLAIDLAVMGADVMPLHGSGDLLWLRFDAAADLRFTEAEARTSLNRGIRVAMQHAVATGVALEQNYPNPFNPSTTISFTLVSDAAVDLSVYNSLGQKVATILRGTAFAGTQQVTWNGTDDAGRALPSGVYIYRLSDGHTTLQRSMMLAK